MLLTLVLRRSLLNPLGCFGAVTGANDGTQMYSCATSAPVRFPLFLMVAVVVAMLSNRLLAPLGALQLEAELAVADEEMVRLE